MPSVRVLHDGCRPTAQADLKDARQLCAHLKRCQRNKALGLLGCSRGVKKKPHHEAFQRIVALRDWVHHNSQAALLKLGVRLDASALQCFRDVLGLPAFDAAPEADAAETLAAQAAHGDWGAALTAAAADGGADASAAAGAGFAVEVTASAPGRTATGGRADAAMRIPMLRTGCVGRERELADLLCAMRCCLPRLRLRRAGPR